MAIYPQNVLPTLTEHLKYVQFYVKRAVPCELLWAKGMHSAGDYGADYILHLEDHDW